MRDIDALIQDLQQRITGRVSDAFDPEYREAVQIDNGRIAHEPAMVALPDSVSDVRRIIDFCVKKKLRLTTKAGGHSASGYCLNTGGVVLDLRRLNSLSFDPKSGVLRAGLGCRWQQVYDYLQVGRTGRIPVGGGCPSVGLAGFLLGGGFSFVSRSYGLGCDNIESLTVVTADSKVRILEPGGSADKDLFWACCGGGGGNFGVGVEVELQTQIPKDETMLMGEITFPLYRLAELLMFYNEWSQTLPAEMAVYGRIAMAPDARWGGERSWSLLFTPVFNGPFDEGVRVLTPLLTKNPVRVDLHRMTIDEWEHYIGTRTTVAGRSAYMRSLVVPVGGLNEGAAEVLMKYFAVCPSPETFMVWTQTGGAIAMRKPGDTAFPHRDAAFVPELKAIWETSKPQDMRRNVEWAFDFYEELAVATGATGAYVNYIDPLLPGWKKKYHGPNAVRLAKVKKKYDPKGLFSFQQSVDSDFEPVVRRGPGIHPDKAKPLDLSPLRATFHTSQGPPTRRRGAVT